MIYAVKNRNTGKYVTGTDFSRGKPRQIMATNRAPLLLGDYGAEDSGTVSAEMLRRGISTRRYKLVPVEVREIEQQRQQAPPERKPLPAGYYNMDCMAALPLFPDDFFDIAVIDAPYGIGADNMAMGTNKTGNKGDFTGCMKNCKGRPGRSRRAAYWRTA